MLLEIKDARQEPGEPPRRWFSDLYFDLYVWTDERSEILEFQLAYDKAGHERVLSWKRSTGFGHARIDDGEASAYRQKAAPVFVRNGPAEHSLSERFMDASAQIEPGIATFVADKLRQFGVETTRKTMLSLPAYGSHLPK